MFPRPTGLNLPVVAAFDFDGTITIRDSFFPFLARCFRFSLLLAASKSLFRSLGPTNETFRDRFKRNLLAILFSGKPHAGLHQLAEEYSLKVHEWIRPKALAQIEDHRSKGHRLVLVSASLELYLSPIAYRLGFDDLLCTKLETDGGYFTGRLAGSNCRGPEKIRQLLELLGPRKHYFLIAYGDSSGDDDMLAAADVKNFKPFR